MDERDHAGRDQLHGAGEHSRRSFRKREVLIGIDADRVQTRLCRGNDGAVPGDAAATEYHIHILFCHGIRACLAPFRIDKRRIKADVIVIEHQDICAGAVQLDCVGGSRLVAFAQAPDRRDIVAGTYCADHVRFTHHGSQHAHQESGTVFREHQSRNIVYGSLELILVYPDELDIRIHFRRCPSCLAKVKANRDDHIIVFICERRDILGVIPRI